MLAASLSAIGVLLSACGSSVLNSGVPSGSNTWASAPVASGTLSLVPTTAAPSSGIVITPLTQFCSDVSVNQNFLGKFPTTSQQAADVTSIWDTIGREAPEAIKPTVLALAAVVHKFADGTITGADSTSIGKNLSAFASWVGDNCGTLGSAAPTS
ncbi:hypothetical protein SAMN05892883_1091 [Jatrophihabitans sp. GAS493]|uniref:hypothetical protein n=1 Tax=Jatrophihabitans sp. GAS493 TaxID=1907575 RepID=UPI000BB827B0|nr:hypothetical protein [Jatrophihabitans sp. GAS493]SOD71590.1 hypothetical protein SAMN05892883_1091 [Jatrophihabitans sp. GAS493]